MKVPKRNQIISYVDDRGIEWGAHVNEIYIEGSQVFVDLSQNRISRPNIERKRVPFTEVLTRGHASPSDGWERRPLNSVRRRK